MNVLSFRNSYTEADVENPGPGEFHCPRCGYDLRAAEKGRCPECGFGYDREAIESLNDEWYVFRVQELRIASMFQWMCIVMIAAFRLFGPLYQRLLGGAYPFPPAFIVFVIVTLAGLVIANRRYEAADTLFHVLRNVPIGIAGVAIVGAVAQATGWGWYGFWVLFPLPGVVMGLLARANYVDGRRQGNDASLGVAARQHLGLWVRTNRTAMIVSALAGLIGICS